MKHNSPNQMLDIKLMCVYVSLYIVLMSPSAISIVAHKHFGQNRSSHMDSIRIYVKYQQFDWITLRILCHMHGIDYDIVATSSFIFRSQCRTLIRKRCCDKMLFTMRSKRFTFLTRWAFSWKWGCSFNQILECAEIYYASANPQLYAWAWDFCAYLHLVAKVEKANSGSEKFPYSKFARVNVESYPVLIAGTE